MNINDIKQKAKEYAYNYPIPYSLYEKIEDKKEQMGEVIEQAYIDGAMAIFDLWKDCFRSCSSPWCRTFFNNFEVTGVLGNLTKKEVKE